MPEGINRENYSGLSSKERRNLPIDCELLTLEMCKQIARKNNPNYIASRHAMAAASARFHQSLAPYLPTVTASYSMYENKDTPRSQGGNGSESRRFTQKTSGITTNWMIFDGLMRTMNMLAAKHDKSQTDALNRDALRLLMQSVRISYNNILLSKDKIEVLSSLLSQREFSKVIVFGQTKHGVEKLSKKLIQRGIKAVSIHGNKSHGQRQQALRLFKSPGTSILVATDVAARGIHVNNVSHVINYDLPATQEDYIHRIGRTGRGEHRGKALTLVM